MDILTFICTIFNIELLFYLLILLAKFLMNKNELLQPHRSFMLKENNRLVCNDVNHLCPYCSVA